MSTRICGAFKIDKQLTFWEAKNIVDSLIEVMEPHMIEHVKEFIAKSALSIYLDYHAKKHLGEEKIDPTGSLFLSDELIASSGLNKIFPSDVDMNLKEVVVALRSNLMFICKDANKSIYTCDRSAGNSAYVSFYPLEDKTLFAIDADFSGFWGDLREMYESYDYQNYTDDLPDGVTEAQWEKRRDDWDAATTSKGMKTRYKVDLFDDSDIFARIEFFDSDFPSLNDIFNQFIITSAIGSHLNEVFKDGTDALSKVMRADSDLRQRYKDGDKEVVKMVSDFRENFISVTEYASTLTDAFTMRRN